MEVAVRTGDLHDHVAETAQTGGDGRRVGGDHARVGNEDDVALEQVFVLLTEAVELRAADLLLALKHELDVALQGAGFHQVLERFGVHERLTLVVVGTASPNLAVLDDGLERLGVPELDRIHGHHVVVAIDQYGLGGGVDDFLTHHDGVALCGVDVALVGAGGHDELLPTLGATHHVVLVLTLRTDGRDAQQAEQFVQKTGFVLFNVILDVHIVGD